MPIASPETSSWYSFIDEPLVNGLDYAPRFSSPQIIMPSQSCDGKWHMFFHSWIGIHHFISDSGIAWQPRKMIEFRGHCPFIFIDGDIYCLLYEKHNRNIPVIEQKRSDDKNEGFSRIEMRTSTDLLSWSKPRILLDSRDVPAAKDYLKNPRLSNPQLFKVGNEYRLYFGASLVNIEDTGHKFPRYFGFASSSDILGHYSVEGFNDTVLEPDGNDRWTNLATGTVRLILTENGFYAFQCGVFFDEEKKHSSSALHILHSGDGKKFKRITEKPIMVPAQEGWARGYITGCDVHYKEEEKCWYCYFSANTGSSGLYYFESIGLLIGNSLANKKSFVS